MFDKEIKFISDFTLNRIKKFGSFFTFEKLLNSDIHPAILQYISAELDYLIYEDRQKLLHKSVFDYSGPQISNYFNLIGQEIKRTKRVSFEDVKNLIVQAVSFNINYIVRPKWSLSKLIFDGTENKTVDEIKLVFNYIYFYDYIKSVYISYLNKKNLLTLSKKEFELIFTKIDKELFSSQPQKLVDNALFSIAEFQNIGEVKNNKIATASVEIFLKEKNLMDYLFRLRKSLPPEAKHKYKIEEVRKVLFSTTPIDKPIILPSEEKHEEKSEVSEPLEIESHKTEIEEIAEEENEAPDNVEYEGAVIVNDEEILNEEELTEEREEELEKEEFLKGEMNYKETDLSSEEDKDITSEENVEDTDDDLLAFFNSELDKIDEGEPNIESDTDEISFDLSEKEHLDSLYDFEENKEQETDEETEIEDEPEDSELHEEVNLIDDFKDEDYEEESEEKEEKPTFIKINERKDLLPEEEFDDEDLKDFEDDLEDFKKEEDAETEPMRGKKRDKDLFDYLSDKEIEKIVSSVFNEDREDFANTMERIEECDTYEEATDILKSVFLTYRVNPYSRDAVSLTNAVSNYFDQA